MTDSGSDNLRDDGYTPSIERVTDLFSWAYAWRSRDGEDETDLSSLRERNRAEFNRALSAEVDRRVADATAPLEATLAKIHAYVVDPGNWSALDVRRTVLLDLLASGQEKGKGHD